MKYEHIEKVKLYAKNHAPALADQYREAFQNNTYIRSLFAVALHEIEAADGGGALANSDLLFEIYAVTLASELLKILVRPGAGGAS